MKSVQTFLNRYPGAIIKALSFGRLAEGTAEDPGSVAYASSVVDYTDWTGLATCPVLVQERIIGKFEWRVTTVGKRIFAARMNSSEIVDWRREGNVECFEIAELPKSVSANLSKLCQDSNIVYGAHDLIESPDGEFFFLETNPAGQWGWLEVALGLPVGKAIAEELAENDA